jgi:hypothetical protein
MFYLALFTDLLVVTGLRSAIESSDTIRNIGSDVLTKPQSAVIGFYFVTEVERHRQTQKTERERERTKQEQAKKP